MANRLKNDQNETGGIEMTAKATTGGGTWWHFESNRTFALLFYITLTVTSPQPLCFEWLGKCVNESSRKGYNRIRFDLVSLPGFPNNRSSIHDVEHEKQLISDWDVTISGQPELCSYISGISNIMGPCFSPDCFFSCDIYSMLHQNEKLTLWVLLPLHHETIWQKHTRKEEQPKWFIAACVWKARPRTQHFSNGVGFGGVLITFCRHN